MSGGVLFQMSEAGMKKATMRYEEGGKFEVWNWNNISISVPAMTDQDEIQRLLVEKARA